MKSPGGSLSIASATSLKVWGEVKTRQKKSETVFKIEISKQRYVLRARTSVLCAVCVCAYEQVRIYSFCAIILFYMPIRLILTLNCLLFEHVRKSYYSTRLITIIDLIIPRSSFCPSNYGFYDE